MMTCVNALENSRRNLTYLIIMVVGGYGAGWEEGDLEMDRYRGIVRGNFICSISVFYIKRIYSYYFV